MRGGRLAVLSWAAFVGGCGSQPLAPLPPPVPANRPPTVSLAGGGCHPRPGQPCEVPLAAAAADADGDALTYAWGGCAQGTASAATCTLTSPGSVTASVVVRDARGAEATASATVVGTNDPPYVRFERPVPSWPLASNSEDYFEGEIRDVERDGDPFDECRDMLVSATGPCRATLLACVKDSACLSEPRGWCGPVAHFAIDVRTQLGPGTCVVELLVWDGWGTPASDRWLRQVAPRP